jgi:hypothetical protein
MNDLQNELNRAVAGFVAQITGIARHAAIDMIEAALNGHTGGRGGRAVATTARGRGRERGAKRSEAELDQLQGKFHSFVKANPGLRIEQINKQLGTSTKDLQLPIRKLIAEGLISAKGSKRSTTYTAGAGRKRKKS